MDAAYRVEVATTVAKNVGAIHWSEMDMTLAELVGTAKEGV